MLRLFLLSLFSLFVLTAQAQTFVPKTLTGLSSTGVPHWADIDNDSDFDIYVSNSTWDHSYSLLNNGQEFIYIGGSFLPFLKYSPHTPVWGDFNQDGFLDLMYPHSFSDFLKGDLVTLFDGCSYRDWVDTLSVCGETNFKFMNNFLAYQGDEDQDGDQDYLLNVGVKVGSDSSTCGLTLYRYSQGSYQQAETIFKSDSYVQHLSWKDFDADGDLDVLVLDDFTPKILQNQHGHYTLLNEDLGQSEIEDITWFDIDYDGDLDIVQSRNRWENFIQKAGIEVYTCKDGRYSLLYSDYRDRTFGSSYGHCEMGDIDNDGDIDILAVVYSSAEPRHTYRIYRNQPTGFLPDSSIVADFGLNFFRLVDYNQDGDLDITTGNSILENTLNPTPVLPSVPAGLTASVNGHDVKLSWQASTDELLPSTALTYNVHIYTAVKGLNYLNGMSNLSTGKRSVLQAGNAGVLTHKTLKNLPDGTYSWMVQAIDPNYNASAYSAPQSFTIVNGAILTGSITLGTLQWLNTCECNEMVMEVQPTGTFGPDNHFFLQLSDSTGSFASPTTLFDNYFGDKAGYHNGIQEGKISGWLPKTMSQGTRYRVRAISTNPASVSTDNGYDIAIKKAPQLPGAIMVSSRELCFNSPDTQLKLSAPALYTNHYSWDIWPSNAGVIIENGLEATVNWADGYSGPVQIRVKGINGCGSGPTGAPLELLVRPLPSPANTIHLPETICPGQTRVLVEVDSVAYADSYEWTLPLGASVSPGTANTQRSILLDLAADFTGDSIRVVPRSRCGKGQGNQALIQVPDKVARTAPIEGPDTLCAGQRWVTFSVPILANATHYEWTLPGGISSSSGSNITNGNQLIVQVANQSIEGDISVVGFNVCFRGEASPPLWIRVLKPATQPGSIQGPVEVCPGKTIASYQVELIQEASSYEWRLPRGMQPLSGSALTATNRITVQVERNFEEASIYLQALNPCGYSPVSLGLLVKPMPSLQTPRITQTCNTLKAEGATASLQWFLNNKAITSATVSELSITRKGTYSVRVYGPCDTLEASLTTEPVFGSKDEIPNAFSPNGDGKNG